MSHRQTWRLDLAGAILLVTGLVVALAVLCHDPTDVPGAVYPPPSQPGNPLGESGAWLAGELMGTLGLAVYPWLATWFVLVIVLLLRRDVLAWSMRLIGWFLLIPTVAVLGHRHSQMLPIVSPAGAGGTAGVFLDGWMDQKLSSTWQILVLVLSSTVGILLSADWAVRLAIGLVRHGPLGFLRRLRRSRSPGPPPIPSAPSTTEASAPERAPASEIRPAPPADGVYLKDEIPITHHGVNLLPEVPPGADEPRLVERVAGLCNGLLSERQRYAGYELPPLHLLEDGRPIAQAEQEQSLREKATLLEKTFKDFGLNVKVVGINTGPVVTMYEVTLETGLRVAKVTSLGEDIALNLKVPSVRMVAPLPGKNAVGIEIPNEHRADVRLKEVIQASAAKIARSKIPLFLGKDAEGRPLICDLADMPHLLIAGATGTGKSVCLTTIILSLLMTRRPDELRMVLIDPKSGVEMQWCSRVPHLMSPIIEDMKKAEAVLAWAVDKMEERYDLLKRARVRNIASYNELSPGEILRRVQPVDDDEQRRIPERMSYIVIVIDEMADLMMQFKKEVEGYIIRLAQKSRAAGIHLILATQKPTVDVITGLIKSNLPSRICFKVAAKSDSRVVLDQMGSDKLLGRGDMLFLPPGTSDLLRAQGAYASEDEIQKVADYLESEPCYEAELLQLKTREVREAEESGGSLEERLKTRDKLYEQAVDIVIREGRGSVSLLQRTLGIGYGRASRLIDFMAQDGIVGTYNGSNARDVLYTPEQWQEMRNEPEA